MHVFDEMQFVSHCYTVVSYHAIFRHSIHKQSAVYLSSARVAFLFFFFFFFARYVNSVPRLLLRNGMRSFLGHFDFHY